MYCSECGKFIEENDDFVACAGACDRKYHKNCSNLGDSQNINISHKQLSTFVTNRMAIILISAIIMLTILIGILIVAFITILNPNCSPRPILAGGHDSGKNIPINSTIDNSDPTLNGVLHLVLRNEWNGRESKQELDKLKLPVHRVIISHTAAEKCFDRATCSKSVRDIQDFDMNLNGWNDVGSNFLIGGDGNVYEGRGWDNQGAHTRTYNTDSIGISFIGSFTRTKPTGPQVEAAQLLLEEGVRLKKLVPDYRLYGTRQFQATESPGDELYKIIRKWPHWSPDAQ